MNCPNCNTPYREHETVCIKCGQPLSNAAYTTIDRPRGEKRRRLPLLILLILLLITAAAGIGYFYYIKTIEKKCREVTTQIFSYAHAMDFSSVDSAYLPDELKENPDIRELIQKEMERTFEGSGLDSLFKYKEYGLDLDWLCDEIVSSASYEITQVDTDYKSCRVTVRTENTDFSALPAAIYDSFTNSQNENNSLWDTIGNFFSSIFYGDNTSQEELTENLKQIYEDVKAQTPKTTETGIIEYGISHGKWTILSVDKQLFYSYYGISEQSE